LGGHHPPAGFEPSFGLEAGREGFSRHGAPC
jgi:hypothetical protein